MRPWSLGTLAVLLLVAPAPAAEPVVGNVVADLWDAAYLENANQGLDKAGYFHTVVHEIRQDGRTLYRTVLEMSLTLRRFNDTVTMRMETGNDETAEGKVVSVFMRQYLGKQQQMLLTGQVVGDQLHVKVTGQYQIDKKIRWNDKVIGLYRQQQLFKDRKLAPGDRFSYLSYEAPFNTVVSVTVTARGDEDVEVFQRKMRLFRVDAVPDKIEVQGGSVQLPAMSFWLDRSGQPIRTQTELPGLGKVVLYRANREIALAPTNARVDIGLSQALPLNRRLPRLHAHDAIDYRITLSHDDNPATAFAQDGRQSVAAVRGKSVELRVRAVRQPRADDSAVKPGDEFLKSNYFINSADARVRRLAEEAVGSESDPWRKAQRIERWVHSRMKSLNFTEAMATADEVARTLEGDCSEYAMLTAAMCRAVNVPSRTAIGLVYTELQGRPVLAYHMWTEVWVRGQWLALDATLGQGSVGASHLKITDHSWHDVQSLTPLLPVMRVMLGKPTIEILRVMDAD
ncbi:MAG: transglutaminase-like domain-containing protein [Gemmataceae bacterium]|nr:transglutaminase-like domain-containing protein [Gemmataceae bacterium]MDW8266572.1 transglutaminase-like domain-containing protein [Gemmataceae bacterium]